MQCTSYYRVRLVAGAWHNRWTADPEQQPPNNTWSSVVVSTGREALKPWNRVALLEFWETRYLLELGNMAEDETLSSLHRKCPMLGHQCGRLIDDRFLYKATVSMCP